MAKTLACYKHEGAFDCTPFCEVCGGEQEVDVSKVETLVCPDCKTEIDDPSKVIDEIYRPETWGSCVDCYDPTPY